MSAAEIEARRLLAATLLDLPYDAETLMAFIIQYRTALQALLDEPSPAAGQLAAIRAVFDAFDWQVDDRQFALEQIDDILRQPGQPYVAWLAHQEIAVRYQQLDVAAGADPLAIPPNRIGDDS